MAIIGASEVVGRSLRLNLVRGAIIDFMAGKMVKLILCKTDILIFILHGLRLLNPTFTNFQIFLNSTFEAIEVSNFKNPKYPVFN